MDRRVLLAVAAVAAAVPSVARAIPVAPARRRLNLVNARTGETAGHQGVAGVVEFRGGRAQPAPLRRVLDIYLPSRLEEAMHAAPAMQRGGVGWYPNSRFIHLDVGPVRNWTLDGRGL